MWLFSPRLPAAEQQDLLNAAPPDQRSADVGQPTHPARGLTRKRGEDPEDGGV